jgi:hypothetical protein
VRALPILLFFLSACAPGERPPDGLADGGCFSFEPEELDFGEVRTATSISQKVKVTNHADEILFLTAQSFSDAFLVSIDSTPFLSPGREGWLDVRFQPPDGRLHLSEVEVSVRDRCKQRFPVRGLGSGRVESSPAQLSFGGLDLDGTKVLELTLTNTKRTAVIFKEVKLVDDVLIRTGFTSPFSIDVASGFELAPLASRVIRVTAAPPYAGNFTARLLLLTGENELTTTRITMAGGTPIAELSQTHIEVPFVEFTQVPLNRSFVERHFTIRNVGVQNGGLDLRFEVPSFRVERDDGGAAENTFQLVTPAVSISAGAQAPLTLRYLPTDYGVQAFRIVLLTNEIDQPERAVTFVANSWPAPSCTMSVPSEAVFRAAADGGSVAEVNFTNQGLTPCVLDDVHVRNTGVYRVLDGGVEQLQIAPGRSHVVTLAGPPVGGARLVGELNFHLLIPNSANETVRLVLPP